MAITFDNNIVDFGGDGDTDRIRLAWEINGVVTTNNTKPSTFDYFPDNAQVGDCVYFGWNRGVWHDLTLNIGTPLVADDIEVVWEYAASTGTSRTQYTWLELPCTDNTNAFQNSGVQTVEFDVPNRFTQAYSATSAYNAWYIRARVVSVTNLTEGGANTTNPATGKDYSVMVTGTNTTQNSPQGIYNSGVAGDAMTKTGDMYLLSCNLRIGDYGTTATRFKISGCTLQVGESTDGTMNGQTNGKTMTILAQHSGDEFHMGEADEGGRLGGTLVYYSNQPRSYNYWRANFYWYNSFYRKPYSNFANPAFHTGQQTIKNCVFSEQDTAFWNDSAVGSVMENCVMEQLKNTTSWYVYTGNLAISNLTFTRGAGLKSTSAITVRNINFRSKILSIRQHGGGMVDCYMDDYESQLLLPMNNSSASVWFTLSLAFTDKEGNDIADCNVEIESDEGEVFNDTWSADFEARPYFKTRDSAGVIVFNDYNPFTITVSKAGYQTYKTTFDIDRKTDLTLTLQKQVPVVIVDGEEVVINADPSNNQNKVNFVKV